MAALRSRQPAHLLAGMTERDFVESGLAVEVFEQIERLLVAEDRKRERRR